MIAECISNAGIIMKISVICVYNQKETLDKQLAKSLESQDTAYELIAINNTACCYSSAASALNAGVNQSTGDILIFSHQDIYLKTSDALRTLAEAIDSSVVGDVIGTQGVREKSNRYYANLTAGGRYIPELLLDYNEKKIPVDCVDEGLFGMRRQTWKLHHFDEKLCDSWHLYAVECCLWSRRNRYQVYVCPIQVHHFSYGSISKSYMKGLVHIADAYRCNFKYIWTTCYKVSSSWLYIRILYIVWVLNRKMRGRDLS